MVTVGFCAVETHFTFNGSENSSDDIVGKNKSGKLVVGMNNSRKDIVGKCNFGIISLWVRTLPVKIEAGQISGRNIDNE